MYSYPITPEQLKVMWRALCWIRDEYGFPDFSYEDETYFNLKEYFEKED